MSDFEMRILVGIVILGAMLCFLIGSIPFGVLLAKLFKLPDPRTIGSGNIGATNMLRTGNKKIALLTLILDGLKGAAPVIIVSSIAGSAYIQGIPIKAIAGILAAMGHMYSPWLKFKGGKGVATLLGALLAFCWPIALVVIVMWLVLFLVTRYVSVASITALAATPFLIVGYSFSPACGIAFGIACATAIWRHRDNIRRLRAGTESKISLRRTA